MTPELDVIGAIMGACIALVYVVRMEGKLNLLAEILERVEGKVDDHIKRYNTDGMYGVIEHKRRPPGYPAE